jgi:nucleotide-binding universal stress UspA family protein
MHAALALFWKLLHLAEAPLAPEIVGPIMMDPSPYKTLAVASTFSPRFEQVLSEAKRIRDRFECDLRIIYVGRPNEETKAKFQDVLARLSLPKKSIIHYEEGGPAEGILRALNRNKIDIVVAGALEKELVLHPFLGDVARRLVREATCSVMLFTKPQNRPKRLRKIVFVTDFSEHARFALKTTIHLASAESCERLYVIRIVTPFDQARASLGMPDKKKSQALVDDEAELEKFILSAGETEVPMEARCVRGNTGFAGADFVRAVEADLLAVPISRSKKEGQRVPDNLAWIKDVIPCNLWMIR